MYVPCAGSFEFDPACNIFL